MTTQKEKTKFRSTSKWKKFRIHIKKKQNNIDPITLKPLYKKANLHHIDLNEEHYTDIADEDNFVLLNHNTHEFLHWCYLYYSKDKEFLKRLELYLDKMCMVNGTV